MLARSRAPTVSSQELDRDEPKLLLAGVFEVVHELLPDAELEEVHVAGTEVERVDATVRVALATGARVDADPEVRARVAVERQPLTGLQPDPPDPNLVVLEPDLL